MPPQLFAADDIRRLAHDKLELLVLGPDDILTREAADTADALGVKVIRASASAGPPLPPLKVVHLANVQVEPFLEGKASPGTNAWLKNVIAAGDGSPLRAGYMSLDKGEMQRTVVCDEIDIVLEGELLIRCGSERVRAKPGDMIFLPKGSSVTLGTPNWTRFACVVVPAGREEK